MHLGTNFGCLMRINLTLVMSILCTAGVHLALMFNFSSSLNATFF